MKKRKSLKANFAFALVGNILYTISQYLILTLLIKNFTSDEVGSYLYALAFVSPIVIPFDMQLRSFYVTERKDGLNFHDYQGFRLMSNSVALLVVLLAAFILKPELVFTIALVGICKILESQSDMYYGAAQKAERMDYISYSRFGKGMAALCLVAAGIHMEWTINEILFGWASLWLIALLLFDARYTLKVAGIKRRFGINFNKEVVFNIFRLCLPVLILSFVDKFAANFPSYIVENKLGLSAMGIFGTIVYFRNIGAQVINPMSAVVAPRLAIYWADGRYADFRYLLRRTTFSAFLLGIGGILIALTLGERLLTILYTSEYAAYSGLLVLVMIYCAITYLYVFTGTALTCLRLHWIKLPIHIISFVVLGVLMFFRSASMEVIVTNMIIAETVTLFLYILSFSILQRKLKDGSYVPKGLTRNTKIQ